jgi:hypothetical protein
MHHQGNQGSRGDQGGSDHGTELAGDHVVGWFEPCGEHRGPDADAPCAHCGWLAVDHTAGLAVVIEVGRVAAAPLRRAS